MTVDINKKNWIEWFFLFMITPYIGFKSYDIYEEKLESMYLYISAIAILLWVVAGAKCKLFNIFIVIRRIPRILQYEINDMMHDFRNWRETDNRLEAAEEIKEENYDT